MPGPFIANLFLEAENAGWTETYYPLGSAYADCVTSMNAIQTARAAISCVDVLFRAMRVSDMTIRGDADTVDPPESHGTYTLSAVTADPSFALKCKETGAGFLRRAVRYLRGVPRDIFTYGPLLYTATPAGFVTALNSYFAAVIANSQLVQRHAGTPPTFTTVAIASMIQQGATIRKAGRPFGLPVGRRVRA